MNKKFLSAVLFGALMVSSKELLRNGGCPLGEVPSRSGFGSKSPFYLAFVRQTGMTPKRYAARERNLVNLEIKNEVLL